MKFLFLLLAFLIIPAALASIEITEVMYNPDICSDTQCEWFELYNPGEDAVNLSSCIFNGKNLSGTMYPNKYLILARNIQNITFFFNPSGEIQERSFTLPNEKGTINITGAEYCMDYFNYTSHVIFANGNNKSLEKTSDGEWKGSSVDGGTPGKENSIWNISLDHSSNSFSEAKILPNSPETIDPSNISCGINISLKTNHPLFYENGQSINFTPTLNNRSFPFVIEYWIEDLFGEIVKPKINTTNTNKKSWKTNIQEQDRILFIKAVVYPSCNDADLSDNTVEEMFIVTKDETAITGSLTEGSSAMNSTINITKISPEKSSFGGILNAEIELYKGTTDKYSVSLWVEKSGKIISEKSKVHLKNKNTFYKVVLPVQIDPNCDHKIEEGAAQLVVEGLGLRTEKEFAMEGINGELCQETNSAAKAEGTKAKNSFEIIDLPAEINPGEVLPVKLQIQNDKDAVFAAWSYLYRGSKCYSCSSKERDENKISFSVDKDETKAEELLVKVDQEISEGEYTLMVKYKKDGQKTEKSITQKLNVKNPAEKVNSANQTLPLLSQSDNSESFLASKKMQKEGLPYYEGIVVYESVSEKSKNLVSWVLFIAFGLLSLVLVWKKHSD